MTAALAQGVFPERRDEAEPVPAALQARLCSLLARAAGHNGMAGGQAIDLASIGKPLAEDTLRDMHRRKTGALLQASVLMGAACGPVSHAAWSALAAYGDALEPHWCEIRTWVLDSAAQFPPEPPIAFSKEKGSDFYKQALEVYDIVKAQKEDQIATAWYWDDNPFALEVSGHMAFARKKISPGGHWINITAHACRKANADIS